MELSALFLSLQKIIIHLYKVHILLHKNHFYYIILYYYYFYSLSSKYFIIINYLGNNFWVNILAKKNLHSIYKIILLTARNRYFLNTYLWMVLSLSRTNERSHTLLLLSYYSLSLSPTQLTLTHSLSLTHTLTYTHQVPSLEYTHAM